MSYYIDALEANTSYRYDQYADAYIYSDGEKDLFSVHIEGMDDYATLFASLDYAVKVEVENLVLLHLELIYLLFLYIFLYNDKYG